MMIGKLCIVGKADFTGTPSNPYYVFNQGTARLNWTYRYSAQKRIEALKVVSPVWFFNSESVLIGQDNGYVGWVFQINNNSCPQRLLSPTIRVSRKDQATLVIEKVTLNDSGVYGCTLLLEDESKKTRTVKLIVTGMLIVKK